MNLRSISFLPDDISATGLGKSQRQIEEERKEAEKAKQKPDPFTQGNHTSDEGHFKPFDGKKPNKTVDDNWDNFLCTQSVVSIGCDFAAQADMTAYVSVRGLSATHVIVDELEQACPKNEDVRDAINRAIKPFLEADQAKEFKARLHEITKGFSLVMYGSYPCGETYKSCKSAFVPASSRRSVIDALDALKPAAVASACAEPQFPSEDDFYSAFLSAVRSCAGSKSIYAAGDVLRKTIGKELVQLGDVRPDERAACIAALNDLRTANQFQAAITSQMARGKTSAERDSKDGQ